MPLNEQLLAVDARYVASLRTAPEYRLYALPHGKPERPGLVRCPGRGVAIEIELWDMSWHALGAFMQRVPAPLTIGTLLTEDGEQVKGFLCESYALQGARDISEFGGYRGYVASRQ
jgi:allophanate hydrolase